MGIFKKDNKKIEINKALKGPSVPYVRRAPSKKEKEYMEKRSFFSISGFNDTLGIIIAVFVSFVGTYLFLPRHGVLSSVPMVIVCGFVCAFINVSELLKIALFFISPFSVSLLLGKEVSKSLILGIVCALIYLFAYASVYFFKKKKVAMKAVSATFLLFALAIHVFMNSTPWNVLSSKKALLEYVTGSYSSEPIIASEIEFNYWNRTYGIELVPKNNAGVSLDVVLKNGEVVKDEYVEYAEKANMLVGMGQLTYVIRKLYPELKFYVEGDRICGYPFSVSASVVPKADYSRYMDFSVYFTSYNGAKEFAELSEKCYRALITSGFCCRSITFYGGIGTKYVAKIEVPFNSLTKELSYFVKPYFEKGFVYTTLEKHH